MVWKYTHTLEVCNAILMFKKYHFTMNIPFSFHNNIVDNECLVFTFTCRSVENVNNWVCVSQAAKTKRCLGIFILLDDFLACWML